jgi:hypothetical protein
MKGRARTHCTVLYIHHQNRLLAKVSDISVGHIHICAWLCHRPEECVPNDSLLVLGSRDIERLDCQPAPGTIHPEPWGMRLID